MCKLTVVAITLCASMLLGCDDDSSTSSATPSTTPCDSPGTIFVDAAAAPGGDGSVGLPVQTIAEGIALASAGGTICVRAGTYGGGVVINKSVRLMGHDLPTVTCGDFLDGYGGAFEVRANGVMIDGFRLDGSAYAVTLDPNCRYGIMLISGYGGAVIQNNTITGYLNAVLFEKDAVIPGPYRCQILGNTIANTTEIALYVQSGHDHEIRDNAISETGYGGILLENVTDVSVIGNSISNLPNWGINVAGTAAGVVTISRNMINSVNTSGTLDHGGIRLYGSVFTGAVNVSYNTITSSFNGVSVKDGQNITGKDIHANFNNLSGNSNAGVRHGGTGALDAENNWWGAAGGPGSPGSDAALGDVDFTPYAGAPIP